MTSKEIQNQAKKLGFGVWRGSSSCLWVKAEAIDSVTQVLQLNGFRSTSSNQKNGVGFGKNHLILEVRNSMPRKELNSNRPLQPAHAWTQKAIYPLQTSASKVFKPWGVLHPQLTSSLTSSFWHHLCPRIWTKLINLDFHIHPILNTTHPWPFSKSIFQTPPFPSVCH